ncbi:MAG: SDR family NAD(P)-dependent oxidoreductase [Acidimicrobiia bacterium]
MSEDVNAAGSGRLEGRIALVTGAGSGIGEAIARRFATEGATVVVNDLTVERAQHTIDSFAGGSPAGHPVAADVADADRVRAMFAEIRDAYGRLDVLVNNAGIGEGSPEELEYVNRTAETLAGDMAAGRPPSVAFDFTRNVTDDSFTRMIGVHLGGCFYCTRAALDLMIPQSAGSIVNISSAGGLVGQPVFTHYSAAKAGILGFTRAVAAEGGPFGIRVNAIAPGAIDTPLGAKLPRSFVHALIANAPIGRLGTPDELAATALYLASDESSFVTGQTLGVNGGVLM